MNAPAHLFHLQAPKGHYVGQLRSRGCRHWRDVSTSEVSSNIALSLAIKKAEHSHNRARTLFVDDTHWYEPVVVAEAKLK